MINIIQRLRFPSTTEVAGLYLRAKIGALHPEHESITLQQNDIVSFNTYFNSFYEKYYAKYTCLRSVYYLLNLEGDFQIFMYRAFSDKEKDCLGTYEIQTGQKARELKIPLPDLSNTPSETYGRIYLEIVCLSSQGVFGGGCVMTDQPKFRDVSLGIVICTFKKEEFVKKTVHTLQQDKFLQKKNLEIYIVDNGNTLCEDEFEDARVTLIANRNVGGSGGFSRGLLEALRETSHTHFLLMDDDVDLESESVCRLLGIYEYADTPVVIAGSLLNWYKKQMLYEAGALYGVTRERHQAPFKCIALKHGRHLTDPYELNQLLEEETIDYGGFWFFAFSRMVVSQIGLMLPFFIKVDDMEFGLRIKASFGNIIKAFPAIAVWHEPFYAKAPLWEVYYHTRNALMTNAIHDLSNCLQTMKVASKMFLFFLFRFEYPRAELLIRTFEDYRRGPQWIATVEQEALHTEIRSVVKVPPQQPNIIPAHVSEKDFYALSPVRMFGKLVRLITLNGHLLPDGCLMNEPAYLLVSGRDQWYKTYRKKCAIVKTYTGLLHYTLDKVRGRKLFLRWIKVVITISLSWSRIRAEWQKAAHSLSSVEFWENYFNRETTKNE